MRFVESEVLSLETPKVNAEWIDHSAVSLFKVDNISRPSKGSVVESQQAFASVTSGNGVQRFKALWRLLILFW